MEPTPPKRYKRLSSQRSLNRTPTQGQQHVDERENLSPHFQSALDIQRMRVINELVESERTFLQHLNIAISMFYEPLQSTRCRRVVNQKDVRTIFGQLMAIQTLNTSLYAECQKSCVITAFERMTPLLKMYANYARNYTTAQHTLHKCMQKERFREVIAEQEASPRCCGLKLPALLITPIQRIPRYQLLLEQMLKFTNDDRDVLRLQAILQQLRDIAANVDLCVRENENSEVLLGVQASLDGDAPKILVPGRRLIKSGLLDKMPTNQQRFFWLFNDVVIYAKPSAFNRLSAIVESPRNEVPTTRNAKYTYCCTLPLRHCKVERFAGRNMFRLACKTERLTLAAATFEEIGEWLEAFEDGIRSAQVARRSLRKESSAGSTTPQHAIASQLTQLRQVRERSRRAMQRAAQRTFNGKDRVKYREKRVLMPSRDENCDMPMPTRETFRPQRTSTFVHRFKSPPDTRPAIQAMSSPTRNASYVAANRDDDFALQSSSSIYPMERLSTMVEEEDRSPIVPSRATTRPSSSNNAAHPWWTQYEPLKTNKTTTTNAHRRCVIM